MLKGEKIILAVEPEYKILSKKFNRDIRQYVFTIKKAEIQFDRTANELALDKSILFSLPSEDIYDVGYTHGSEAVLKERVALLETKRKLNSK
ncbi:MAG: hypothetical protein EPO11_08430 [Gammaproteobacteria bacterium]|nr:MAG: hypothetical protein EPO11_08430 [Gammaproteobacteria bacterium]